jgi:tetratricopeptide (TPR) repeat protein
LVLDRNLVNAHSYIGLGKILTGRAEETEAHIVEALRLSPRDTMAYVWMSVASIAKNNSGSYEQAVAWSRRAIEANRNYHQSYFWLGAALAHLGRLDDARSAVMTGLALNPAFTIFRARAAWTAMSDNPVHHAAVAHVLEGMREAGAPEQ